MKYEGPIYRPPSEADSLLIQTTLGCPHNRCTFCMVYKNGPNYKVRDVAEIKGEIDEAAAELGGYVRTLFFPAGNSIAMETAQLAEICSYAYQKLPKLERITVYGSSQYIHQKGVEELRQLKEAGLSRIHVGLESGDDEVLRSIRKGCLSKKHIEAGQWVMQAGIELSLYVLLGIGGREGSQQHALETAQVLSEIDPTFIRLRTFVPKINTPLLEEVESGIFEMLGPHGILRETHLMIENLQVNSSLKSDHYTNYVNLEGRLPVDRPRLLSEIEHALLQDESQFRAYFVGNQ